MLRPSMRSERGAIIIQVAIALLGLMAFSAFVLDYGVMWASRGQVQTSADAAAIAGAVSLTYDNTTTANVKLRAQKVGLLNTVWGAPPDIQTSDIEIITCPPTPGLPNSDTCVRARAFRNQARSNALPTIFARLAGVNSQGVQAVAVARAIAANGTSCLKPWVVGDKWLDTQVGGWDQTATYVETGAAPTGGDSYVAPTATDPGTGFSAKDANGNPTYYGYQMVLKLANPGQGANEIPINSAGWAMELALNNADGAAPNSNTAYTDNINGCTSDQVAISPPGSTCTVVDPSVGCLAVKTGSGGGTNARAVADFIATHDPTATWTNGSGASGWQTGTINTTQNPSSRIVPVGVFDVPEYIAAGYNGTNGIVRIVNILGFFVEGTCQDSFFKESYLQCPGGGNAQSAIVGRMVNYPGLYLSTGGSVYGAFGEEIVLVR